MLDDQPLPERYDVDEVVLMPVDPKTVFAYWEVRETSVTQAREQAAGKLILRIVAVTASWEGPSVETRDIEVREPVGDWFVRDLPPGAVLRAALGWRGVASFRASVGGDGAQRTCIRSCSGGRQRVGGADVRRRRSDRWGAARRGSDCCRGRAGSPSCRCGGGAFAARIVVLAGSSPVTGSYARGLVAARELAELTILGNWRGLVPKGEGWHRSFAPLAFSVRGCASSRWHTRRARARPIRGRSAISSRINCSMAIATPKISPLCILEGRVCRRRRGGTPMSPCRVSPRM